VVLPKTAKLLPPETVLLVDIDNFSELKSQFEKTSIYKLYKDPAMAAFIDDMKAKWRPKIREMDNEFVRTIVDANVLPQGRVAVAFVLDEQKIKGDQPPLLLITQWGEKTSKIKEAIDKIVEKAIEDGAGRKTEDYRGVSIITIIQQSSQAVISYCFIDDCLIASLNLDILKFVIAHIKGSASPTLAGDTDYTATIAAIGPYHDIDFYVNIKQVIKTIIADDSTGKAQSTITNLGLDNVTALGYSIGLDRASNSCCGKALLKIEGAKKGICKMLEVESAGFRAPRFIPASAYSVSFLNLNIKKAYDELYNILYSFNPTTAAIMHTPLPPSPDGQPGLELKSGIIDHLGSQIVIAQSTNKPFSAGSTPTEFLVALAVNNPSALEKSLSVVHSMMTMNNPDARRELLGHTIYLVDLMIMLPAFMPSGRTPMQVPAQPGIPQMPKLAFTITDTHLIFGAEPDVDRAIRTLSGAEAESVNSASWFTSAKLVVPSVVGMAGLQDAAASSELFWWMMKEGTQASPANMSMGSNPALAFAQQAGIDFSLLPEFDTVRKYFGLSVFYGISRPDGFFFEFKYLNPSATD